MALHAALAENRCLQQELQHRVKNNIQIMLSLVNLSARRSASAEAAELAAATAARLHAMASAQEVIYQAAAAREVSFRDVLSTLAGHVVQALDLEGRVELSASPGVVTGDEAHCLALIANELSTNAGKHGRRAEGSRIRVTFERTGDQCELMVCDNGPGLIVARGQGSGLTLVRGLCRQIGGRLEMFDDDGACCRVHFQTAAPQGEGT